MTSTRPTLAARLLTLTGWSRRSDVERVRRYTEISLYSLHWIFVVMYGFPALSAAPNVPTMVVTVAVVLGLGLLASRAVKYTMTRWGTRGVDWRHPAVWQLLVGVLGAVGWGLVIGSQDRLAMPLIVAITLAWGLGGLQGRGLGTGIVLGVGIAGLVLSQTWQLALVSSAFAMFMVFTMQSSLWLLGVVVELDRARAVQAELAVAQERLRFSSDVHDVMGRHLSVIAVQSEVAAAMVDKGDARAGEKIRLVRASAHDALREARELARGYRPLDLAQELRGAVSLLASAGVRTCGADGPLDVDAVAATVPSHRHDLVARVVREAITNVIRHSGAAVVTLTVDPGTLTIRNDGVRSEHGSGDGSGLATLRRTAEQAGGTLDVGVEGTDVGTGREFVVVLTWP